MLLDPYVDAGMEVVSPLGWGARVNYDDWDFYRDDTIDKYVIHWPGSNVVGSEEASLRAYEAFHIDVKGWRGIAYDWAIGRSGALYRLRGTNRSAATSGDIEPDGVRENTEAEAVLFIVSLDGQPTVEQLNTFRQMFVVRPLGVFGHRDNRSGTECPGDIIYGLIQDGFYLGDDMSQFLTDLENFAAQQGVSAWNIAADLWQNTVAMADALGVSPGDQTGLKHAVTNVLARIEALEDESGSGDHGHEATVTVVLD